MLNRSNKFKAAVDQLTAPKKTVEIDSETLTSSQKKDLLEQTKMYIFLQELLEKIKPYLSDNEEIIDYLPLTNEENSRAGTVGVMGMTYATTTEARDYLNTFYNLRGNRLIIFTNERMIFLTIIEFLESRVYFSYPYESIHAFKLKKHKVSYLDWKSAVVASRGHSYWYTLDFQSNDHVFTEMLTEDDAAIFKRQLLEIPPLQTILVDEKVHRNTKADLVISNVNFWIRLLIGASIFCIVLFIIILISFLF